MRFLRFPSRWMFGAAICAVLAAALPAPRAFGAPRRHGSSLAPAAETPVIVDTDAGTDDLLAIAFLLGRQDIRIEAITIVNGLCHVPSGAKNVLRLLQLAGHPEIPVYAGATSPLTGHAAFPFTWRRDADTLPGVTLPDLTLKPQAESATTFLTNRLEESRRPVQILALGPLTNIAAALQTDPRAARAISEIVIMGGALNVPGNLGDGGYFRTTNTTAEWNFFVDPFAASIVLTSGAPIRLIPLDATRQVPIRSDFAQKLSADAKTPLQKFASEVLATEKKNIAEGIFYAWDPLAAVALADPSAVNVEPMAISVTTIGPDTGRTVVVQGQPPNARVATSASANVFRGDFLEALATQTPPPPPTKPVATPTKTPVPTPATAPKTAPSAAPPAATSPPATSTPPANGNTPPSAPAAKPSTTPAPAPPAKSTTPPGASPAPQPTFSAAPTG